MELDDIVVGDTYIEGNIVGDSPQPAIKQATGVINSIPL